MNEPSIGRAYLRVITIAGFLFLFGMLWLDRQYLWDLGTAENLGELELLVFVAAFGVLSSLSPIRLPAGVNITVSLPPLFAGVLTLHPGLAALAAVVGTIDNRVPGRQIPWDRFLFNRAMFAIVYGMGGLVFHALVQMQPTSPDSTARVFTVVAASLIALLTMELLNSPMVILASALLTGERLSKVAYRSLQGAMLSVAGLAPLGALIAYLLAPHRIQGLLVSTMMFLLLLAYRELSRRSLKLETVARGSYVAQSRLIDKKDRSTFGHSERVGLLAEATAAKMGLATDMIEQVRIGATLHDLGKIAIPDAILHKPGHLNFEEWQIMKTHPQEGYEVLSEQDVLETAAAIVLCHHENYDGTGYPRGIAGPDIPVGGRIARVVDSYDCMINVRDYRAWVKTPIDALSEITSLAGTTYDRTVVEAFEAVLVERHPELSAELVEDKAHNASIGQVVRHVSFLKLWGAQGLSNFGDMLTTTGLALAAYGAVHSTWAVGAVFAARAIPNLLFGLVAGPVVDRYDRKGMMILMDLLRAGLIASIPFLVHTNLLFLLAITFFVSTATALFNPARSAVLPDVVPRYLLQTANSWMAAIERITEILGYAAAGIIIILGGIPLVFAIDAVTFMFSAALILTVAVPRTASDVQTRSGLDRVVNDMRAGIREIRSSDALRVIFPFSFLMAAAAAAMLPLMVPLAIDHLHAGNLGFALLEASIAVGATAGALLAAFLKFTHRGVAMVVGGLGMGLSTIFVAASAALPVTMIFFALSGAANMLYLIPMLTVIQERSETRVRGRIFAARFTLVQLGVLFGMAYAAILASRFPSESVGVVVLVVGLLMVVVSSGAALSPAIRRI